MWDRNLKSERKKQLFEHAGRRAYEPGVFGASKLVALVVLVLLKTEQGRTSEVRKILHEVTQLSPSVSTALACQVHVRLANHDADDIEGHNDDIRWVQLLLPAYVEAATGSQVSGKST